MRSPPRGSGEGSADGGPGLPVLPIPRVPDVGPAPGGGYISVAERGRSAARAGHAGRRRCPGRPGYAGHGRPTGLPHTRVGAPPCWPLPTTAGWDDADASPTASAALRRGSARLRELPAGLPEVRQIINGDLLYHNVLVEGPRVFGGIDWGDIQCGDALYDAGWLLFWSPGHLWSGIDFRGELNGIWARWGAKPPDVEAACGAINCASAWSTSCGIPGAASGHTLSGPCGNRRSDGRVGGGPPGTRCPGTHRLPGTPKRSGFRPGRAPRT